MHGFFQILKVLFVSSYIIFTVLCLSFLGTKAKTATGMCSVILSSLLAREGVDIPSLFCDKRAVILRGGYFWLLFDVGIMPHNIYALQFLIYIVLSICMHYI